MKPPYNYQLKARDFITTNGRVYLMVDCGLGKTRATLMAVQKLLKSYPNMQTLVFAPVMPCLTTWPAEIQKWTPELTYTVLHGPSKNHRCSLANAKNIIIIPYSSLNWFYNRCQQRAFPIKKYAVVFDESSMLKNPNSKRVKMFTEMAPMFSDFRIALSGTSAPNGLVDLWSQYFLLDDGKSLTPNFSWFRNRYFNYTGPPHFQTTIKHGAEKHIYEAIAPMTLRLESQDYLDLPPLITNDMVVKLPSRLQKIYEELEEEFCLTFPDDSAVLASSAAALSSKLRQFLQGAVYGETFDSEPSRIVKRFHTFKAQMLKELLTKTLNKPVLCAIQFRFEYEIICEVLKQRPPLIAGQTPATHTQGYIAQWNKGSLPLLIVHPASISHGVNIQSGGNILVWMALPWSLELYQQLIARLVRQGQQADKVVMYRFLISGTKDIDVARVLSKKNVVQQDLYDALKERRTR